MKNKRKSCDRKKGKLIQIAILCAAGVLTLTACGGRPTIEEQVRTVLEEQEKPIREKIEKFSAGDEAQWDDLEGVLRVHTYNDGTIEFECIADGILTASVNAGFYYSPDDKPDGDHVGWLHGELAEDGDGYSYSDGTDNSYYTERICENFYYFIVRN